MLLVILENSRNVPEVALAGLDFFHQACDRGSRALVEGVLALDLVKDLRDRTLHHSASLDDTLRCGVVEGEFGLHFFESLFQLSVLVLKHGDSLSQPHHPLDLRLLWSDFDHGDLFFRD